MHPTACLALAPPALHHPLEWGEVGMSSHPEGFKGYCSEFIMSTLLPRADAIHRHSLLLVNMACYCKLLSLTA